MVVAGCLGQKEEVVLVVGSRTETMTSNDSIKVAGVASEQEVALLPSPLVGLFAPLPAVDHERILLLGMERSMWCDQSKQISTHSA